MSTQVQHPVSPDTGMEMHDLSPEGEFMRRPLRSHDPAQGVDALRRLARVFAESPEAVLQELVNIAVEVCGADSAGISLEVPTEEKFRWIAIAGTFAKYLHGTTPRFYSPCGTTLDAGRPQHYRLRNPYYDFLGVEAREITDGLLIPWTADGMRGTLWIISHTSREAFDMGDYRMVQSLADFAAIAVRHQMQQKMVLQQAKETSAIEMANELAHQINNPLQSLTNTVYLAAQGGDGASSFAQLASEDLHRLSGLVQKLLKLKTETHGNEP